MANNQLVYTIELRNGKLIKDINDFIKKNQEGADSIEQIAEANKKLIAVAKQATDRTTEGYKKLAAQISANKAEVKAFNQEITNTPNNKSYEQLRSEIDRTANTIEGLRLKQKLLKEAFEKQEIGSQGYAQLQLRLKETNLELKKQLDTVKKSTQSLGGVNESAKFAAGSYGELRQNIKTAKDELQKYTVGSKQYEVAQKNLNELLQKEVDIRRTQPSLFQTRITQAINESDAVKKLQTAAANLRLEQGALTQASKDNADAQAEVRKEMERTAKVSGKSSAEYKELEQKLKSLETQEVRNTKEFKRIREELQKTNTAIDKASKGFSGIGKNLKTVGALVVAKLGFDAVKDSFLATVKAGATFEQKLKDVQAVSGATGQELRKIEQLSLKLGGSTQFTSSEVAELAKEYSKLGFTINEIVQVAPGTLDLATATGTTLQESAVITGATLRAFQLDVSETSRVVDVLALSSSNSALDMEKISNSLKFVAPVAAAANIDLEAVVGTLGALANVGIDGSRAGTSLRRIFSDISTEGSKLTKTLGFTVKTGDDLIRAFKQLQKEGVDNAKAQALVGREAQSAFVSLVAQADKVEELAKTYDGATGSAERIASVQRDSLNVAFLTFLSAIEALQINITKYLNGPLRGLLAGMTSLVNLFNDFIKIPVSEQLKDEQRELGNLVKSIQVTNKNQEARKQLIEELQAKYPDFLKNIDAQTVSNEQLAGRLLEVNQILEDNIRLQVEQEKFDIAQAKRDAVQEQRKATQKKLTELLIEAEKEYGVTIKTTGSATEIAADAFEQLRKQSTASTLGLNFFAKNFVETLNELRFAEEDYSKASEGVAEAVNGKIGALRSYVQDTGDATKKTELLTLELEQLNKQYSVLSAEGADANQIASVLSQIKATQKELSALEIELAPVPNAEDAGDETGKDFTKGFSSQISKIQREIADNLELGLFDVSDKLAASLEKFGEDGKRAAKRAYEQILSARIKFIDQQNDLDQTLLESEYIRNEQSLNAFIETEKAKLEQLESLNDQKKEGLIRFASTEQSVQQEIADKNIAYEEAKLKSFLDAANKKLEVLRQAGKAESLEAKKIQLEILKEQEAFEDFKLKRIEDLNDQQLESILRNKALEIEVMREGNQKVLAELQLNQVERFRTFNESEEKRLEDFSKAQAEYRQKLIDADYEETQIERKLATEREKFIEEKEQREQALRDKFAEERLQLRRDALIKESQLVADFINVASERGQLESDFGVSNQILALQQQLKNREISLKEFEDKSEGIQQQALEVFREKQKQRTEALIVELEKQADLLAAGTEEEKLQAEELKNEILRIKKQQVDEEIEVIEKGLEGEKKKREDFIRDLEEDFERILQVLDIAGTFFEAASNNRIGAIDKQIDRSEKRIEELQAKAENANEQERLSIEAKIKSEESLIEGLDKKKEDLERKEFERNKAKSIAEALIAGALAILKATPNPFLIALASATTAAQVALIASQSYAIGGLLMESIQSSMLRQSLGLSKYAKGDLLADGLQVLSHGHIPSRSGIISGPPHAAGGIKARTASGRIIEVEGQEPTAVQGTGANAIRLIYTKKVARNPFLKQVALMTESGKIDPIKLAVGSFINRLSGGKDFYNTTGTGGLKFEYGGSLADRMTPRLPMSVLYNTGGATSGGFGSAVVSTNDALVKMQIAATEKQNRLIAEQNALLQENTQEVRAVSGAINALEADATIPFTKKVTDTQQKIQQLSNNAK